MKAHRAAANWPFGENPPFMPGSHFLNVVIIQDPSFVDCISFVAGYQPLNIDLIGCDFSGNFEIQPMDLVFNTLCENLSENNINCINKS